MHVRFLRVQLLCFPELRDRLRQFVFQFERESQIVVQCRVLWKRF